MGEIAFPPALVEQIRRAIRPTRQNACRAGILDGFLKVCNKSRGCQSLRVLFFGLAAMAKKIPIVCQAGGDSSYGRLGLRPYNHRVNPPSGANNSATTASRSVRLDSMLVRR